MTSPALYRSAFLALVPLILAACSDIEDTRPAPRAVSTGADLRPASEINEETLIRLARGLEEQGDLGQALRVYSRVVSDYPASVEGRLGLARVYTAAGAPNRAYNQYIAAFELAPENSEAVAGLARNLAREGNLEDAQRLLELQAGRGASADLRILRTMGLLQDLAGQHEAAQLQYARALDQRQSDTATLNLLALSFGLSGETRAGLEVLNELNSSGLSTIRNRAILYALAGDAGAAELVAAEAYSGAELNELVRLFRAMPYMDADMRRRVVMLGIVPDTLPEPPPAPGAQSDPAPSGQEAEAPAEQAPQPPAVPPVTAADEPSWQPGAEPAARQNLPGRYWVQLASFTSRAGAETGWVTLNNRAGEHLAGYLPYLDRFEGADGTLYFRLLVGGFADAPPARQLCSALEAAGQTCFVTRKAAALTPLESTP